MSAGLTVFRPIHGGPIPGTGFSVPALTMARPPCLPRSGIRTFRIRREKEGPDRPQHTTILSGGFIGSLRRRHFSTGLRGQEIKSCRKRRPPRSSFPFGRRLEIRGGRHAEPRPDVLPHAPQVAANIRVNGSRDPAPDRHASRLATSLSDIQYANKIARETCKTPPPSPGLDRRIALFSGRFPVRAQRPPVSNY
jgi:hypothetical protein